VKIGSIGAQPPNGELGHFSSANSPRGIAVNNATGNVYVADFNNQRIDEFSSGGTPIRAWGNQVVASGPDLATPISAVQTLTVTATGGRYTLRFSGQSTGEIEAGAGKFTAIQTALTGLSSVGSGNVTVSETSSGVYKITFGGTLANTPEPLIETESGPGTPLTGGTASVANTTTGTTGFTVCNAGSDTCKVGSQTAARGGMQGPTGVAIDQSTGNVYVTEQNNRRVDEYTSSGEWIATWGLNVVSFGQDNTGTGFEICKATSNPVDICQAGAAGGIAGGAFKEPFNSGIAVEPAAPHDVLVADQTNNRVQVFSPSGEFVEAFGFDVVESGPDNTGTGFEVCKKVEGDVCKAGTGGTAVGQFGAATGASRLAADGNGNVYVVDFVNKRVLKFTPGGGTFTATEFGPSGPTATPFAVAIDPTTNNVLIGREASGGTSEMQVAEYSPSDTLLETHGVGSKISEGTASSAMSGNLAYYPSSGNILLDFISTTAPKVFILNNTPAPTVHFTEVANLSATSATFKGTVTPPAEVEGQRSEVTWRFEYSTDNAHWTKAPPVDKSAGSEPEVADPVEESVTGLRPDTTYFVRLCATTGPGSEACDPTPAREFTTLQETPTIVSTWPEEVTQTEATLGGEVDPNSLSTTYHFEWGTEPGVYTHRVPGVERHIGAGSAGVVVQEKISGLEPATEYHYRLIATNSKGTVTGTDQIVETLDTCGLPDDRCYELVSPPDKGPIGAAGDSSISAQELQFQAAPEGSAIAYQMAYGLPEATSGTEVAYLAQRSAHGWTSGQLAPAIQVPVNNTGSAVTSRVLGMASDLSCGIYVSTQPLTEGAPTAALDAGKALLYSRDASGQYALISDRVPTFINGPDTTLKEYLLVGMSEANGDNCGRVIFRTAFQYEGVPGAGRERLYEWDHGVLRNVGVIPGPSGPVVTEAVPGAISATVGAGEQHATDYWNAVSDDASRVVFSAKSQVGEDANQFAVFVRDHASGSGDLSAGSTTIEDLTTSAGSFSAGQEISGAGIPSSTTVTGVGSGSITLSQSATADGEEVALDAFRTVDASQSQTATANNGSSRYEVASDNGNYVFFAARYGLASPANGGSSTGATSCSVGTEGNPNGTGCDLYRYSLADGRLVDLSADTTDAHGASVAGVLGASEDGDRIYFAARGKLTSGGRTEAENVAGNTYGVYLWEEGDISYVGRVPNWEALWVARSGAQFTAPGKWNSRVTPDGRDLLFESNQNLTGYESGGAFEAYLFGAASGSLTCISCRHDQKPSVSSQTRLSSGGDIRDILGPPRTLAGDGGEARVFFFSEDALATGAIEGKNNLYQWEHGQVTFIGSSEPGTTNLALRFAGSSADGNDVYFTTVNRLDWEDVDGKLDVYDARVGGGFVQPPAPPAACQSLNEGSCQGVPAGTSAASAIASTAEGRGNPKAAETKKPHPHKKKRYRHRRKRHHHTRSHKRTGTDRRHAK
jgi:DNA-binding beta-propeller fold protein YncE